MNKIVNIEEYMLQVISEVICLKCYHRWIAVRPVTVLLRDMECPECKSHGVVIETGQFIEDERLE